MTMKTFDIAGNKASRLVQGCMRIGGMDPQALDTLIKTDIENGINFFDHADIYGGGRCEEVFGRFLAENKGYREKMLIQTKCGIKSGTYDFTKEHILEAVNGSLRRLGVDYVDFLLLHRPDTLVEPEEVAETFAQLKSEGKVRFFGVSNHNPLQIALLNKYLGENRVIINQLQFSMTNTTMIDSGINVNMENGAAVNRDDSVLDYCRLNDITIQPWSPFQYGFFEGAYIGSPKYPELNSALEKMAEKYGTTPTGMVIAWILRHPAKMQPIAGSTNHSRMKEMAAAADITITHDDWYFLYRASGKRLP